MASPNTYRKKDANKEDLYITPLNGLEAMSKYINPGRTLYDPCAGLGDMSEFFRERGNKVITSDLYDYGYPLDYQVDFLSLECLPEANIDTIVFNPPYLLTSEFLDHALHLCPRVVMFNRLTCLEGKMRAKKWTSGDWPLTRCDVFSYRVSCDKGVNREPTANSVPYAVYVLDRELYTGHTQLSWIV